MVRQVVQGSGGTSYCFQVVGVVHDLDEGGDHLRRREDGVTACLLFRQLMDHRRRLTNHDLVFIVQQLRQLRDRI